MDCTHIGREFFIYSIKKKYKRRHRDCVVTSTLFYATSMNNRMKNYNHTNTFLTLLFTLKFTFLSSRCIWGYTANIISLAAVLSSHITWLKRPLPHTDIGLQRMLWSNFSDFFPVLWIRIRPPRKWPFGSDLHLKKKVEKCAEKNLVKFLT